MNDDKIKAKLMKLLALARQGVGGEKENAERMLQKMLDKYGMTLADLDDAEEKREQYKFTYRNEHEKGLLVQCAFAVVPGYDGTVFVSKWVKKTLFFELTRAEHIELDLMFEAHRKALAAHLKKMAKNAYLAYIHKNRIYRNRSDDESDDKQNDSELSPADLAAIIQMMDSLQPTQIRKALAA